LPKVSYYEKKHVYKRNKKLTIFCDMSFFCTKVAVTK